MRIEREGRRARHLRAAIGALLAAGAVADAHAATEVTAHLEEVTVTARRQAESLQDAPIAVSAFTAATIADRGIADINQLATFTPGLSFSQAFGRSTDRPVVRGQSNVLAGVQFGVESGTAYFLDGVYYNGDVQAIDFDSLERVEVIKGPQSALYGRNTYAGAINFVTRDPGTEWTGSARASAAQHDERTYALNLSGPIAGETLSARFGARYNEYGGEYANALTGAKVGQERDWSVNGTLVWKPFDGFRARVFGSHREQRDGALALFLVGAENNDCMPGYRSPGYRGIGATGAATTAFAFGQLPPIANANQYYCGVIHARPDRVRLNTDALTRVDRATGASVAFADGTAFDGILASEDFASLALEYDVGGSGWTLTSLSGYRHRFDLFGTDSDHSEAQVPGGGPGTEPLFANTNRNDTHEWSTEVKLASPTGRRVRGALGAYRYENEDVERDLTYASPEFGVLNANAAATGIENRAVFGSLAFDITGKLTAAVEVRRAKETKYRIEYLTSTTAPFTADGAARPRLEGEYAKTTPRITVDYRIGPDALLYGILAKGAKPGGINGSAGAAVNRPTYDQETSDNVELGAKTTWLDGRLRANLAVYYTKARNVQVTQAVPGTTAVTSVAVNQGAAEIRGGELQVQAALSRGLGLDVGLAYTAPKFTRGCDDFQYVLMSGGLAFPAATQNDPAVQALCSIAGKRLPLVPKVQASAAVNWETPLAAGTDWTFYSNVTATYESSKYVQVHNLAETGSTALLGARLGIRNDRWTVTAFGRNLTDEDTIAIATRWFDLRYGGCITGGACRGLAGSAPATADRGSPRSLFATLRKGRTFGLEVRYAF